MTTEQIYDEQISPLMTEIIKLTKEHKIGIVAQFCVRGENGETLRVNTVIHDKETDDDDLHKEIRQVVLRQMRGTQPFTIRVEKGDGSQEIHTYL